MKKKLEITLSSIHCGSAREVLTLGLDGKDPADKFLNNLKKKDPIAFKSINTRIKAVAKYEYFENDETFSPVGDGVYEFKRNNPKLIRLYAFYDEIEGIGQLILCTNGGDKTLQSQDIKKAKQIRSTYLEAKKQADTKLIYREYKL